MRALRVPLAALAAAVALLALPDGALACNGWTQQNMQTQLMCIVCHERLDQSNSAFSHQVEGHLATWCRAGWTAGRVRNTLVAQFGEQILAAPPKHGFWLLAWIVPIGVVGAGLLVAGGLALAWSRGRRGPPAARGPDGAIDPAMDARIDADLAGFE
jgi:cytochrome c-type biogenesis protein CcmH